MNGKDDYHDGIYVLCDPFQSSYKNEERCYHVIRTCSCKVCICIYNILTTHSPNKPIFLPQGKLCSLRLQHQSHPGLF